MKISVIGSGYVGLVTGTCLAEMGNKVVCVDIDEAKITKMKRGMIPIYEPQLEGLFRRNIDENRLSFTTSLADGVEAAEVIFLALPTPPSEDGSADLSYVLNVAAKLGSLIKSYKVVINKSTVPVGTAELVRAEIAKNAKADFDVVSNPEFLREGFAVDDFMKPDRVVIGTKSDKARKILKQLYGPFIRQGNPIIFMDERSAEMTKYAANSFLATKISFMNEIANLCERLGANVDAVRLGIGSDERIGKRFLFPGIGYGGSCFPKDVLALHKTAQTYSYDFKILEAVTNVNDLQKQTLYKKISGHYGKLSGKKFALWGLAFKPDTDDIREAPALEIIRELTGSGAKVTAYDPEAMGNVKKLLSGNNNLDFATDEYEALKDVDALLIATEWPVFRTPDFKKMAKLMKAKVIFDGRNLYNLDDIRSSGFYYNSVGRELVNGD